MAAVLKKLAGQTAVYGLSGMLGRFLNYLLVPLHTAQFVPSEYGVITDVYALAAFAAVLLTWGLETAYFRFSNRTDKDPEQILGNVLGFMLYSSLTFAVLLVLFLQPLADALLYSDNKEFILWMGFALLFDAAAAIPLARLRNQERPLRFATVQLTSIAVNILLNIFFIGYILPAGKAGTQNVFIDLFYRPEIGVGYVFLANLVASSVKFLFTVRTYRCVNLRPDTEETRLLLKYSLPLMFAGFAGMINEILDRRLIRIILEPVYGEEYALSQVGIYGAVYKLSIVITLFIQAFRYAAEPFFFAEAKKDDTRSAYAFVLNWFTITVSVIFLIVLLYLDVFKHFISNERYWEGLYIVPILLTANIFLGFSYNLSVWYKLSEKTQYGAYLAGLGAVITVVFNLLLVPELGYEGAAWTTLLAYVSICTASYFLGKKFYPINYNLKKVFGYFGGAWAAYGLSLLWVLTGTMKYVYNTALLAAYCGVVFYCERKVIYSLINRR